jgi:hypothetical protein
MFGWLKKLFGPNGDYHASPYDFMVGNKDITTTPNGRIFHRVVAMSGLKISIQHRITDERYWQYFCPKRKTEITPGPSGGGTNSVCEKCKINYGFLDWALER